MVSYKVVKNFNDRFDYNRRYLVGNDFPRQGLKVSGQRIEQLIGGGYIEELKEEIPFEPEVFTAEKLSSMTIAQITALAQEYGYTITKSLKAEIIDEFMSQQ